MSPGGVRERSTRVVAALGLITAAAVGAAPSADAGPHASPVPGVAQVGPLFGSGLDSPHTCTATVLRSPSKDLILTAAHCISGDGVGMLFAPAYASDSTPYGTWKVVASYVDPRYLASRDPHADVAILQVAKQDIDGRILGVQQVVRGGYRLGVEAAPGTSTVVTAYNAGLHDQPVSCTTAVTYRQVAGERWPEFDCGGYRGGSSGSAFTTTGPRTQVVTGVIGGLNAGGCTDAVSYSAPFDATTLALKARANSGGPADVVPRPGPDGC